MKRSLLRWLALLLIALGCWLPPAHAQRSGEIERGYSALPRDPNEDTGRTAALPFAMAGFFTLIVMVIVCMPSRKS